MTADRYSAEERRAWDGYAAADAGGHYADTRYDGRQYAPAHELPTDERAAHTSGIATALLDARRAKFGPRPDEGRCPGCGDSGVEGSHVCKCGDEPAPSPAPLPAETPGEAGERERGRVTSAVAGPAQAFGAAADALPTNEADEREVAALMSRSMDHEKRTPLASTEADGPEVWLNMYDTANGETPGAWLSEADARDGASADCVSVAVPYVPRSRLASAEARIAELTKEVARLVDEKAAYLRSEKSTIADLTAQIDEKERQRAAATARIGMYRDERDAAHKKLAERRDGEAKGHWRWLHNVLDLAEGRDVCPSAAPREVTGSPYDRAKAMAAQLSEAKATIDGLRHGTCDAGYGVTLPMLREQRDEAYGVVVELKAERAKLREQLAAATKRAEEETAKSAAADRERRDANYQVTLMQAEVTRMVESQLATAKREEAEKSRADALAERVREVEGSLHAAIVRADEAEAKAASADVIVVAVTDGHEGEIDVMPGNEPHSHHYVPTYSLEQAIARATAAEDALGEMRTALEWYAEEAHHCDGMPALGDGSCGHKHPLMDDPPWTPDVLADGGDRARAALAQPAAGNEGA